MANAQKIPVNVVGLDVSEDGHTPEALCIDCMGEHDGQHIVRGEEWGGRSCNCIACGAVIDVTLVYGGRA